MKHHQKTINALVIILSFAAIYLAAPLSAAGDESKTTVDGSVSLESTSLQQETKALNTSSSESDSNAHLSEAGKFHIGTDPTIWILIVLFNLALAISIERTWYMFRNRGNNALLVNNLLKGLTVHAEEPEILVNRFKTKKYGIEGRVASRSLMGWKYGVPAIREFALAALESEKRQLEKRLVVLSTLGNNTPFIGLLGTVLGIMKAFRDLAMVGDAGPAIVMKGISEALIATAFGLAVAIPCVIVFNIFAKKVKTRISNAEEIIGTICGVRYAFEEKGLHGVKDCASHTLGHLPQVESGELVEHIFREDVNLAEGNI